jgi:hypothetical protein
MFCLLSFCETHHYLSLWGRIVDDESLAIIERAYELPVTDKAGMHYFERKHQVYYDIRPP